MTTIQVLHVDDEPDIREVAEVTLGLDPDFKVRSCGSGKEARWPRPNGSPISFCSTS